MSIKQLLFKAFAALLLLASPASSRADGPARPTVVQFSPAPRYKGNPGAEIRSLQFSDGMDIKVAVYPGAGGTLPPVGIVAGYGMDISYLHYMATQMRRQGYDVFLVQPPGNGSGEIRSRLPDNSDGYHNTIEGFGAMYMDGLGEALHSFYGRKIVLMGHSRAGYQIRFFRSGLRYQGQDGKGRPVLAAEPQALEAASTHFAGLVSLYSPLKPDARLVELARRFPRVIPRLRKLEEVLEAEKAAHIDRAADTADLLARTSPLNLMWGIFAPLASDFNGRLARKLVSQSARAQIDWAETMIQGRTRDLLSGKRELDGLDRLGMKLLQRRFPDLIDPNDDFEADLQASRWMVGGDADDGALDHMMKYSNRRGPTPAQSSEMEGLSNKEGLASWMTLAVSPEGKPYSVIKQVVKGSRKMDVPYLILEAEGDGSWDAAQDEGKLLGAVTVAKISGGHGGAVLNPRSIGEMHCALQEVFDAPKALKP